MIKEIAFTAYPVTDMARARAFYEGVLGLTVETNHGDKWVEYDLNGGTFVIQNYTGETPSGSRGLVAFEVDDLDGIVAPPEGGGHAFHHGRDRVADLPLCHGPRPGRHGGLGPQTQDGLSAMFPPFFFGFLVAAVAACGLLGGCRSEFHVILFNNTNDQIIFRRRAEDPRPAVILSCTGGDVTGHFHG